MEISTHPRFDKHYRKLSEVVKEKAKVKEKIFRLFPFDSSLRTHKLHGKDQGAWAFWIDYRYRVKFISASEERRANVFICMASERRRNKGFNTPPLSGRRARVSELIMGAGLCPAV